MKKTKVPFLTESLSVIIPAYKESTGLVKLIRETVQGAIKISKDFEIIIINDGSPDDTGEVAESLAQRYKQVRVVHHKKNMGLAQAWKTGIMTAKKKLILYIEGDGQQPFKDQYALLEKLKNADLVLGSRSFRHDYTFFRLTLSYGFLLLIRLLFGLKYKDVNWSQAYRKKIFRKIKIKSVSPFFDTEVVIKALRNGFKVDEADVIYRSRGGGSTSLGNIKTAYNMFVEMLKMKFGYFD